jgi:FkbM family methyltransferase
MKNFELLDYKNSKIYIAVDSETEKKIRLNSCRREPQTVEWIDQLPNGSIFFDIGANVGCYSLIAADQNKKGKNIQVYSFEPHFANFNSLVMNIHYNKLEEYIVPINMGVSNKEESSKLFHWDQYNKGESGSSGHQLNRTNDFEGKNFEPNAIQSILSVSIDTFCKIYQIFPNAIKIDVDGIEDLIIKGMEISLLTNKNLTDVLVEINEGNKDYIENIFRNHGFNIIHHSSNNNVLFKRY